MNSPRRPAAAFTLIELLTVIAIIGILAAIIIPVTGRVRASARSAKCSSNLRQLAQSMLIYAANDSKGFLPFQAANTTQVSDALLPATTTPSWIRAVAPILAGNRYQVDQVFSCPNVDPPAVEYVPFTFAMNGYASSNAVGYPATGGTGTQPRALGQIRNPSRLPLLRHTIRSTGAAIVFGDNNTFTFNDGGGKFNYAFADGHVARAETLIPAPQWVP